MFSYLSNKLSPISSSDSTPVAPAEGTPTTGNPPKKRKMPPLEESEGGTSLADIMLTLLRLQNQVSSHEDKFISQNTLISSLQAQVSLLTSQLGSQPAVVTVNDEVMEEDTTTSSSSSNKKTVSADKDDPPKPPIEPSTDLERSVVIARLRTDRSLTPQQQVYADYDHVVNMTGLVGVPVLPLAVYRMPIKDPDAIHDRLVKVLFPTKSHAGIFLSRWKKVHSDPRYDDVFVRASIADPAERKPSPPGRFSRPNFHSSNTVSLNPNPHQNAKANANTNARPPPRSRLNSLMSQSIRPSTQFPSRPNLPSFPPPPPPPPPNSHPPFIPPYPQYPPPFYPNPQSFYPIQSPYMNHISNYGAPPQSMLFSQGNW